MHVDGYVVKKPAWCDHTLYVLLAVIIHCYQATNKRTL